MWIELARAFQNGDMYIYTMLGLAFIGMTVFLERVIMVMFVFNLDFPKFLSNVKKAVKADDIDRAISLSRSASKTSLPLITLRALEASEADPSSVRGIIEEESLAFLPRVDARTGFLPVLASIILLLGVLGTIDALWEAFHSLDVLDTAQKQAVLGGAVAGALTYSGLGIAISMFLLLANHIVRGMSLKLLDRINQGVSVISNLLVPVEISYAVGATAQAGLAHAPSFVEDTAASLTDVHSTSEGLDKEENSSGEESSDQIAVEDIKDEEEII